MEISGFFNYGAGRDLLSFMLFDLIMIIGLFIVFLGQVAAQGLIVSVVFSAIWIGPICFFILSVLRTWRLSP